MAKSNSKLYTKGIKGIELNPKKVVITAIVLIGGVIFLHLLEKLRS